LIYSFNGKPQALPADFACACGSPLNEDDQHITKSIARLHGNNETLIQILTEHQFAIFH
jgi:hypothetical protein